MKQSSYPAYLPFVSQNNKQNNFKKSNQQNNLKMNVIRCKMKVKKSSPLAG